MSTHNIGFYEDLTTIISIIIKYAPYLFLWLLQRKSDDISEESVKKVRAEDGSGDAPAKVNGEPEKSEKTEEEKKVINSRICNKPYIANVFLLDFRL